MQLKILGKYWCTRTNLTSKEESIKWSFHGQRIKRKSCETVSVQCLQFLNSLQLFPISILSLPKEHLLILTVHNHSDHPNLITSCFWKGLQPFCSELSSAILHKTVRFFKSSESFQLFPKVKVLIQRSLNISALLLNCLLPTDQLKLFKSDKYIPHLSRGVIYP